MQDKQSQFGANFVRKARSNHLRPFLAGRLRAPRTPATPPPCSLLCVVVNGVVCGVINAISLQLCTFLGGVYVCVGRCRFASCFFLFSFLFFFGHVAASLGAICRGAALVLVCLCGLYTCVSRELMFAARLYCSRACGGVWICQAVAVFFLFFFFFLYLSWFLLAFCRMLCSPTHARHTARTRMVVDAIV